VKRSAPYVGRAEIGGDAPYEHEVAVLRLPPDGDAVDAVHRVAEEGQALRKDQLSVVTRT
jgi:hypothetical protein